MAGLRRCQPGLQPPGHAAGGPAFERCFAFVLQFQVTTQRRRLPGLGVVGLGLAGQGGQPAIVVGVFAGQTRHSWQGAKCSRAHWQAR